MKLPRSHKVYFPNLNGLRFLAAFCVIINHVEQLKRFYSTELDPISAFAKNIGKLGVMLFFVLSGFLITYLLISEENSTGKIHSKNFYIRRFLRIAPLYFLSIVLVYFVIHQFSFWDIPGLSNLQGSSFYLSFGLYVAFLPNLVEAIYGFIPYLGQTWSIGTEEQAYLLWPIFLSKCKHYKIQLMIGVVITYTLVRILLGLTYSDVSFLGIIYRFWNRFNIDAIAVGGFFAVMVYQKHRLLNTIINTKLFYGITMLTLGLLALGVNIPYFHYLIYSILFGIIITNLACNHVLKNSFLETRVLSYLGKISYGIYMYHFLVMMFVLKMASTYHLQTNWFIYLSTWIGTLLLSIISYHYIESIFLQLKEQFTIIGVMKTKNSNERKQNKRTIKHNY